MLPNNKKIVKHLPSSLRKKLPKEIAVITIDKAASRRLNRGYRQKDKPTNVLSFRYSDEYAEILVCPSSIRRQAKEQGNSYDYQMTWMIVHGMLHIAGMHHEKSKAIQKRVSALEKRVLKAVFGQKVKN